ncbi:hypothetical protein [Treponema pedis]|uniref:Uncharacterized protein n=1 Tax=Treponema pedis TaxID=409322 RepID=A0A7S6WQX8_9SPIR|nr:hypothetical protein [Treponema pedis]QOW61698.1 hypothetical protein IFE08_04820 [Treponema pedis]
MTLSSQEIRHALYQGKGTVLLKEFAGNNFFKEATDNSINDVRMAAREIILHCVSFMIVGTEGYLNNDNMDSFLRRGLQILNFLESPENLISKRIFASETKPHFSINSYDELKRKFELGM